MNQFNNYLYNQSGNLTFRSDNQAGFDPTIIRKRSVLRPALTTVANVLLGNYLSAGMNVVGGEYANDFAMAASQWALNTTNLSGTNIDAPDAKEGMISILPTGHFNFTMYEDNVPETRRFTTTTTTKTISGGTITIELSSDDINYFQVDDLLINWSDAGAGTQARVTSVDYANATIDIVAWAGSAFTNVTDFAVSTTSEDVLEVIGTAVDIHNPSVRPTERTFKGFRELTSSQVKTYNLQMFEDGWASNKFHDANLRAFGGDRPIYNRNRKDTYIQHMRKISSSLIWGKAQDVTSSSNASSFNGLYHSIPASNKYDLGASGSLGLSAIDHILVDILGGTHSSNLLYGFCSFKTLQIIESLFNSLASNTSVNYFKLDQGFYGLPVNVIRYRGKEVHLIPVSDFMDEGNRNFVDQTASATGYASKLFFIDPEAVTPIIGANPTSGAGILFEEERDVESTDKSYYGSINMLRTYMGFALRHPETSAIIENVKVADLTS